MTSPPSSHQSNRYSAIQILTPQPTQKQQGFSKKTSESIIEKFAKLQRKVGNQLPMKSKTGKYPCHCITLNQLYITTLINSQLFLTLRLCGIIGFLLYVSHVFLLTTTPFFPSPNAQLPDRVGGNHPYRSFQRVHLFSAVWGDFFS